ncbi:Chorismate binding protein [Pseudopedobacter saltans DSM 12145]|uniref:Chorismate binding protein n=1 Tax=Pseudopedobacter saltans (strain ATCC 51119 / DSM 12145 / JCM 21818 / CCUG 39354 / LMG 10337 / NBRC 100064 / NCIMB 13643) TaxID=762903 RepID=F0SAF6_PSESL|nr:anthranilate synthase component I family protein [Pseudopedobacter saltans]ADY52576.1 Chorismate binding protein [Pseudopedobacter saltans DSM 12145]
MVQLDDKKVFIDKALQWADQFQILAIFDSNSHSEKYAEYDLVIAADYIDLLETNFKDAFGKLEKFKNKHQGWLFGGLGYDLKNDIESLKSENPDYLEFPDCFFFVPKHILLIRGNTLEVQSDQINLYQEIQNFKNPILDYDQQEQKIIRQRFSKDEYIRQVKDIQNRISAGDIYETNFCMEFYGESPILPLTTFHRLNNSSDAPFSAYFRWFDKYIICASPERFLAKRSLKLISQPIKGTAKRGNTPEEDDLLKDTLYNNPKERQENVMIVDLVRNDLTKCAKSGTVRVEELFGIYSFKQVHQMISTIVCEIKEQESIVNILKSTFPMGSMTGAPKIKAMELMEFYERSKRGIYSGAIGYITPEDDFDFNVVIRSILYNATNQYFSFHAGSAITYYADAEKEYEECLLKIGALVKALNGKLEG